MKKDIHPTHVNTLVICICGNSFHIRSAIASGKMCVDMCLACHLFYTGKQKILDTDGRVTKLEVHYSKRVCLSK